MKFSKQTREVYAIIQGIGLNDLCPTFADFKPYWVAERVRENSEKHRNMNLQGIARHVQKIQDSGWDPRKEDLPPRE